MDFTITPVAREYIRNKGAGAVTVKLEKRQIGCGGCCGATDFESPSVKLGAPQADASQYRKVTLTDVDLFVHSSVQSAVRKDTPKIDMERTFFGRKLVLYGLTEE